MDAGKKRIIQKAYILIIVLILCYRIFTVNVYAFKGVPEKIRIGLYFERNAVNSIHIKSETGVQLGYEKDGTFISLIDEPSLKSFIVRKDSYYVNTGDGVKEYWPGSPNIPAGAQYGPYHIQIGSDFSNYAEAKAQIKALEESGLKVFIIYYNGIFKVSTGLFTSDDEAINAIDRIKKTVKNTSCQVIAPAAVRVQVLLEGQKDIIYMFDGGENHLMIQPLAKAGEVPLIYINGTLYRGGVELKRLSNSDITVINVVDFEQYLYGVLPKEMGGHWPLEALKAQAVAARTYAILHMSKYSKYGFNLCASSSSQVYDGYNAEHPKCTEAVEATRGQVLTYQGSPATIYYFSTSGGATENVINVWGGSGLPYLVGVDDKYEVTEKADKGIWKVEMTSIKIEEILRAQGYDIGKVIAVTPLEYSEAGRVTKLRIKGTKGEQVFEKGKTRSVFGANFLNSQYYKLYTDSDIYVSGTDTQSPILTTGSEVKTISGAGVSPVNISIEKVYVMGANAKKSYSIIPYIYVFEGRGWGHGVGLSQWGARGMADAGFTYNQILTHYFPGTNVE